jgi:von Willebrand factor type A domain
MWTRARRARSVIPSPDTGALRGVGLRTRIVRGLLVTAVVGLLVAAAWSARAGGAREQGLLPGGSTGVVILDVSQSISDEDYARERRAIAQLIADRSAVGLIVFSDVPYELLPPGTPANALRPLLRLLAPPRLGSAVTPWSTSFSAGTRISVALKMARDMLRRDHVEHGSILLISDVETAPEDVGDMVQTLSSLRSALPVRVVALSPTSDGRLIVENTLGNDAFVEPAESGLNTATPRRLHAEASSGVPIVFIVLGLLAFLTLATHERFAGRLALARSPSQPRRESRGQT